MDQALAAEPGFHSDPPQSGGLVVMAVHRLSDNCSELAEQQPKNFFPLALIPAETLGGVMEDGAGGAAFEAASRLMIEFLDGDLHRQAKG